MALGEMVLPLEPEQEDVAWSSWVLRMDGVPDKPSASSCPRPARTPLSLSLQKGAVLRQHMRRKLASSASGPVSLLYCTHFLTAQTDHGGPINKVCDCYLKQMERGQLAVFQEGGRG